MIKIFLYLLDNTDKFRESSYIFIFYIYIYISFTHDLPFNQFLNN